MKRFPAIAAAVSIAAPLLSLLGSLSLSGCSELGAWDQLRAIRNATPWFDAAWPKRIRLTFANGAQNEDLLDFPVLIVLDPSRIDYADLNPDGSDLRFVDSSGGAALLPYEIERWVPGGTSYAWVGVPRIDGGSNSDSIWLYCGNPGAASGENPAAVWNDRYVGVWHLASGAGDSSRYGNHGTATALGSAVGPVGGAGVFDGMTSHVEIADSPSLDISGSLTLEAWIRKRSSDDRIVLSKYDKGVGIDARSYDLGFDRAGDVGQSYLTVSADGLLHDAGGVLESGSAIGIDEWHYVVGSYDNSDPLELRMRVYLDGYLDGQMLSNQPSVLLTDETVLIGAMWQGAFLYGQWNGDLDEVRISDTARSADWTAAQHRSMTDTFVSFGGVQSYQPPF
jgi:hypothetical protein